MSAQPADAGQWRPAEPSAPRTPKQRKRELRKDRSRRRRIAERAHHDPTLTDFEVRVLDGFLWHSDETAKYAWPTVPTVAAKVHGEPRSVRRCVAQLEVAGYLERFMRPVPGQRNKSNLYYFREPPGPVPNHRPDQRRRPRKRRSDSRTPETAGTPEGLENPGQRGPQSPAPPLRKPGHRRDLPTARSVAAQPPAFVPAAAPDPPSTATPPGLEEARAKLQALRGANCERRPASGGPGDDGNGSPPAPAAPLRAPAARAKLTPAAFTAARNLGRSWKLAGVDEDDVRTKFGDEPELQDAALQAFRATVTA